MIEIAGLPAHILLIHGVVVLAPLAGIAAIVYGAWRAARKYLAWPLGVLSLGLVPLTLVTAQAGEQLERTRAASHLLHEHVEQGDLFEVPRRGLLCGHGNDAGCHLRTVCPAAGRDRASGLHRAPADQPCIAVRFAGGRSSRWRVVDLPEHHHRPLRCCVGVGGTVSRGRDGVLVPCGARRVNEPLPEFYSAGFRRPPATSG